jgi:hypothetical protein
MDKETWVEESVKNNKFFLNSLFEDNSNGYSIRILSITWKHWVKFRA